MVGNSGKYKLIDKKGKQVSSKTYAFEGSAVASLHPEYVFYQVDGLWGIAKIK